MWYEINVAKNGKHYFATDKRSIGSESHLVELYSKLEEAFPKSEGYELSASTWSTVGEDIDIKKLKKKLTPKK